MSVPPLAGAGITPIPPLDDPRYTADDVVRREDGLLHYTGLPQSLVQMLRDRATGDSAEDEAVVELGGERVTYAQLWDRATRVAGGMRDQGIRPGDRVAILSAAGVDWVLAFLGAIAAGAIAVPVNTRFAPPEVEYVLADCGAAYVQRAGQSLPEGDPFCVEPASSDVAAIFYTSGTTGRPKGALTTHEAFLSNCESSTRDRTVLGPDLRTLISVPLFHVTGCNSQLLTALYCGGCSVIMPQLDIALLIKTIETEQISVLVTVPAIYAMMLNHPSFPDADVSSVQGCGYGGAPISPDLVHRIKAAFSQSTVTNGFGMTETASLLTALPDEYAAEHADSVGFQVPVIDLALYLMDPATGVGELLVRGPNITTGYWNKPERTRDAFVDGWLRTGDVARVSSEGLVYIVDRAKDVINRGGENVYSVEVENALAGAPGVFEAAVVAVPNERLGEAVGAVIVSPPGQSADPAAITAYLDGRIADFKIPQYIIVSSDPLPRNPGGKILKGPLRTLTDWGERLR
ncbi:class I adenylate-forming enzyme family protein [Leekyejoonella antrihumi]|uniref:Long-chain fatty acid--CoA ligase n=1 Tax=Leekyejoonella antrihumi TaxID=1660198 RepID=A0A563DW32_9MICO|nr:AMP-binding protein [Leekyejoonella antrihumi]TWP34191.1 long-chain fatty acid--CoA ligase [Leekyejoonella antrihumi]